VAGNANGVQLICHSQRKSGATFGTYKFMRVYIQHVCICALWAPAEVECQSKRGVPRLLYILNPSASIRSKVSSRRELEIYSHIGGLYICLLNSGPKVLTILARGELKSLRHSALMRGGFNKRQI
jgi:hypothetical protein